MRVPVLALVAAAAAGRAGAAEPLPSFAVDAAGLTVAGISSGGFMAVQLGIAYSSRSAGVAIFACGSYHCAGDSAAAALGACATGVGLSVQPLVDYTWAQAYAGTIDAPQNLAGKPFYLFSGTADTVVRPAVMDALQQYLLAGTPASEITYDDPPPAAHAWVSPDGSCPPPARKARPVASSAPCMAASRTRAPSARHSSSRPGSTSGRTVTRCS